jgi:hypothetical protein
MDIFCQICSGKAQWPWDVTKVINHSCQRCFQVVACNDFSWRKPKQNVSAAPRPKDLVASPTEHVDIPLPKAKGSIIDQMKAEILDKQAALGEPVVTVPEVIDVKPEPIPVKPADGKNSTDKMLDALQPNRPGIKLESRRK